MMFLQKLKVSESDSSVGGDEPPLGFGGKDSGVEMNTLI